jgi:hypothetical protein
MENKNHLFQPGQSGNPAGRPKGNANRTTIIIRELFASILEEEQDNFREALETLRTTNPKEYVTVMTKLSQRFLPEMTATALSNADGSNIEPVQIILPPPKPQED